MDKDNFCHGHVFSPSYMDILMTAVQWFPRLPLTYVSLEKMSFFPHEHMSLSHVILTSFSHKKYETRLYQKSHDLCALQMNDNRIKDRCRLTT